MSTPGASIPIGVYRGRGCGISAIGVYENFIGREVQNVVDFMGVSNPPRGRSLRTAT